MIPVRYNGNDTWPHKFSPTGRTDIHAGRPIKEYKCDCGMKFWYGVEVRPIGVCPARKDRDEKGRLFR